MTDRPRRKGRVQLVLIAAVFLGPLAVAAWMYHHGGLAPSGRTNHGVLLEPIVNLADAIPASAVRRLYADNWLLLYAQAGRCDATCRDALYTLRQSRKMLGKDMIRLNRVFLHGETPPDTLFLRREHVGLTALEDADLMRLLDEKTPAAIPGGGYFLIDPLGNLVMYFPPDLDPADMVDDIRHLLRLSNIG